MRFRFFTLPALLLLIPASRSTAIQDFSTQGSNEAKWAQGEENIAGITRDTNYLENRLNLDLYSGNLRLGARFTLLDVNVPMIQLPVRPGRNLSAIIEVASRNYLLKAGGHHSAREFQDKLGREILSSQELKSEDWWESPE